MNAPSPATADPTHTAQSFYEELERNHLVALWNVNKSLLPKEPKSRCVAAPLAVGDHVAAGPASGRRWRR